MFAFVNPDVELEGDGAVPPLMWDADPSTGRPPRKVMSTPERAFAEIDRIMKELPSRADNQQLDTILTPLPFISLYRPFEPVFDPTRFSPARAKNRHTLREMVGTGNGTTSTFTGTLGAPPVLSGKVRFSVASPPLNITDDGKGSFTGAISLSGPNVINYATGVFTITFSTPPDTAEPVVCLYDVPTLQGATGITAWKKVFFPKPYNISYQMTIWSRVKVHHEVLTTWFLQQFFDNMMVLRDVPHADLGKRHVYVSLEGTNPLEEYEYSDQFRVLRTEFSMNVRGWLLQRVKDVGPVLSVETELIDNTDDPEVSLDTIIITA